METMRYQENKKSGKWPIIFFLIFVVIGGGLIVLGILNEDSPQIVGGIREEVQGLVDIYAKETIADIYDEEKISINDITYKIDDEIVKDSSNKKFEANILLPKVAVMNEEDETLTVFAVNKNLDEDMELNLELRQFADYHIVEAVTLTNPDMKAVNTERNPDNVVPVACDSIKVENGKLSGFLGKHSWNMIHLAK